LYLKLTKIIFINIYFFVYLNTFIFSKRKDDQSPCTFSQ